MKKNPLRWQAIGWLLVLAAPATLQAQSWHWATAPSAIVDPSPAGAMGGSVIVATAADGAGNTVVAGNFSGSFALGGTTLVRISVHFR